MNKRLFLLIKAEIAFFFYLLKHITMTEEEINSKLNELAIIKKVMIDKSNFDQAALIGEDERILRAQLEEIQKQNGSSNTHST